MNLSGHSEILINEGLLQQAFEFSAANPREDPEREKLHASTQLIVEGSINLRSNHAKIVDTNSSSDVIKVSLTKDGLGDLHILGPKEFMKASSIPSSRTSKKRRVAKEPSADLAIIPASIVKHQVDDAILCSALSGLNIPLAFVNGPFLHRWANGDVILRYSLGIVPNEKVVITRQQPLALRFLSRVCQDPSLSQPQQSESSPWDLLNLITLPASSPATGSFRVEGLVTEPLPYQCESLRWCLRREGMDMDDSGHVSALTNEIRYSVVAPSLGWRRVPNSNVWVNPYTLRSCFGKPLPALPSENVPFRGRGLLAEEMGLGKTLEMIALSLLNPRPDSFSLNQQTSGQLQNHMRALILSKATLVIVPKTILYQWVSEVKLHAPHLTTLIVESPSQPVEELISADFVFVTYSQLSRWLPFSKEKRKRDARQNRFSFEEIGMQKRPENEEELSRSTLIDVEFWRVILDEVQMVNSGISAAAQVARRIPRVHAWAASGTPVRHSLQDLRGIISFLELHPFTEPPCWRRFISSPIDFSSTMKLLAIRHTKATVKNQLHIPEQHRMLFPLRFSDIETARYNKLQKEFLDDDAHPNCNLASWLLRLRQACSHTVAQSNNGSDVFALTKDQVLAQLLEESELEIWTQQREKLLSQLQLGQLYDLAYRLPLALKEWKSVMDSLSHILEAEEARSAELVSDVNCAQEAVERLEARISKATTMGIEREYPLEDKNLVISNQNHWRVQQLKDEGFLFDARRSLFLANGRLKSSRARCRSLKELLHRTYFYLGTGYFRSTQRLKLKLTEEELSSIEIQETIKANHEQEVNYYGLADRLRGQILNESAQRVEDSKKKLRIVNFNKVSKICTIPKAKIADMLASFASELLGLLQDILTQPLIEDLVSTKTPEMQIEKDGLTEENDAYAKTLDLQEFAHIYLEMLQVILRDRAAAICGGNIQPTPQIAYLEEAGKALVSKLVDRREELVGLLQYDKTPLISLLKRLGIEDIKIDSLKQEIRRAQNYYSSLQDLYNHRIEFYKQLQVLSDQVSDLDTGSRTDYDTLILQKIHDINVSERGTHEKQKKQRYLRDLGQSSTSVTYKSEEEKYGPHANSSSLQKCAICLDDITHGAMTPCAHYFCESCLQSWLPIRQTCPLCNRQINRDQVYKLRSREENLEDFKRDLHLKVENSQEHADAAAIVRAKEYFTPISDMLRRQISSHPIVREYGVKIDTIVKHAIYLRSQDPLSQIVVFSQWGNMLKVLRTAFTENKVSVASTSDPVDNVNKFRENPDVACLLLQAKVDVAGLTLVNANHVFLCEPLLNTALEWQAVSRINRIGQTRETTVWQFCVEGTVEQAILAMTTKSRTSPDQASEYNSIQGVYLTPNLVDKRSGSEIVGDSENLRRLLPKSAGARPGSSDFVE